MRGYLSLIGLNAALAAFFGWSVGLAAPPSQLFADRSPGAIPVDVELVVAVDISYSMDPEEQALQREGYITGFTSREFMAALRQGTTIFWSYGPAHSK